MGTLPLPDPFARVLFGRTRRDVLALLLGRPDERFHMREIFRRVGGGFGAVQRELKQLTEAGLLDRKSEGRQVYFSANRSSAIFPELQAIIRKTAGEAEVLRTGLEPLVQKERIAVAFVYGSVATGWQTSASDVDLMILGSATLAEVIPAVRAAEQQLGREINPFVYPVSEFRRRLKAGAPFLERVLAEPKLFVAGDDHELGRLAR